MTKVEEGAFYEHQLPGETAHQFQAFCCYRDLGITRRLKKAAELFYSDGSPGYPGDTEGIPETGGGARLSRFKAWSREHSWIARVEAYDLEEDGKRSPPDAAAARGDGRGPPEPREAGHECRREEALRHYAPGETRCPRACYRSW